ncbi:MAG: RHS repeat-associated core domain-containing protein [Actinobacteria bacterium]|nr:RHS repeat-associated core domain-containing protein [Actinomycetota bacterium]
MGSTRLLTDASGESVATFTYGPYGALTGKTGTATTALGYAGEYTLSQSGLQYLRARFYDPATAQFLTRDPAVETTRQPYLYGGDNPLRFYDRTGQACEEPVNIGGFIHAVIPNPIDCFAGGGKEILESPVTGPAIAVSCGLLPGCPEASGLVAGIATLTAGNLLHSENDPCFELGPAEVGSVIATVGAALPGLVVEAGLDAAAGSAGVPAAVRVATNLPGWILEGIRAAEGQ